MKFIPGSRDSAARLAAAAAALVTVGAGLGLRAVATGSVAKYGGDALYTVLLLTLVVLVAPRLTPLRAAATALAASWAVEFLQLTALPGRPLPAQHRGPPGARFHLQRARPVLVRGRRGGRLAPPHGAAPVRSA